MPFNIGPFLFSVMATSVVALGYFSDAITQLDEKTQVPLSMLITVACSVWLAARWVTKQQDKIERQISSLNERFNSLMCQREDCSWREKGKHK